MTAITYHARGNGSYRVRRDGEPIGDVVRYRSGWTGIAWPLDNRCAVHCMRTRRAAVAVLVAFADAR